MCRDTKVSIIFAINKYESCQVCYFIHLGMLVMAGLYLGSSGTCELGCVKMQKLLKGKREPSQLVP